MRECEKHFSAPVSNIVRNSSFENAAEASCKHVLANSHSCAYSPELLEIQHPTTNQIQLWSGPLSAAPDCLRLFLSVLSADELDRVNRYKNESLANKFTVARGTLRFLLGSFLKEAPNEIEFVYGDHGKPELKNHNNLRFNLSHCDELMVLGLAADGLIGVDVEQTSRDTNIISIARKHFFKDEIAALESLDPEAQRTMFFSIWTRREAVVKALGTGLSLPIRALPSEEELARDGWFIQNNSVSQLSPHATTYDITSAIAFKPSDQLNVHQPDISHFHWDWQ